MEARLTADFWVRAYLARLGFADIPAYVLHKGDPGAGAVLVKCATLDGRACLWQRAWVVLKDDAEPEVDAAIRRQRSFDPDLWVIEIESRTGRTLLDEEGLSD
jgi:hypothetical protein